jgi:hypothetical protein
MELPRPPSPPGALSHPTSPHPLVGPNSPFLGGSATLLSGGAMHLEKPTGGAQLAVVWRREEQGGASSSPAGPVAFRPADRATAPP